MARRWLAVERTLLERMELLAMQMAEMKRAGQPATTAQIQQMQRYQALVSQAQEEARRYALWSENLIARKQADLIARGVQGAQATIRASYFDAGVIQAAFDILPVEAVEFAIGYASDGSALKALMMKDFPATMMDLLQALIDGTAMGRNPRDTARLMADAMSGNLQRALTIARTEQLRAFRDASRQQMAASGVVNVSIRRCALNPRTCAACLALDGTVYPTDELMPVHPEDRCFMQPMIIGLQPVKAQSGQDWFLAQDEATQRGILGPQTYDAWNSGAFEFRALASTHVHKTWGPSVRVTPLKELVGS